MNQMLVVVGAGGFGRETLDVVEAVNARAGAPALTPAYAFAPAFEPPVSYRLIGVLDDAPSPVNLQRLADRSIRYLGTVADWLRAGHRAEYIVAIGNPGTRAAVVGRFSRVGLRGATLVHPTAVLGSRVSVGEGTVICAGARVSTNVAIGRHTHLNPGATIGHDTLIADFVSVNPAATVSGECRIGAGALIGAGAVVLAGLSIGAGSTVGASACVTRPVEAGAVVRGVPAAPSRTVAPAPHRAYSH